MRLKSLSIIIPCLLLPWRPALHSQETEAAETPYADWVEPDFPFFSSILDAREVEGDFPGDNLTPRGLVLNLGRNLWVCFDTDLLRVAAIWEGKGVTPDSLGPKSYHPWGGKTTGGQEKSPEPDGKVWLANGIYPGWQTGNQVSFEDPREPAPSPEEVGRGPLPESVARMRAVRLTVDGVLLEYSVETALVRESFKAAQSNGRNYVERHVEVTGLSETATLVLGKFSGVIAVNPEGKQAGVRLEKRNSVWTARIPAGREKLRFCLSFSQGEAVKDIETASFDLNPPARRWPQKVVTRGRLSGADEAYVVDHLPLPLPNPWRRNIRPGDMQFLETGMGIVPTLDGDVWLVHGVDALLENIRWTRFASGLHEPMTAAIREGEIYVFDRNGIWRLVDTDGNGEADVHELFSNAFAQTADMREFPSTLRLAPGGAFVIAKGGQQASTLGKHNGSVLGVSADGRKAEVLGYGFRQPSIGVNIRTGLVTSSDQEGQYIPTTPLHIVRDNQFYGYLADGLQEREKYPAPIAKPLTWLPHAVNASAMSQVWLFDAKFGPLNNGMVHIGFNRPELFRVMFNNRGSVPQAAVVSITTDFEYPPLNGSVNPADGMLYIAGYQINGWGNALDTLAGLGRVRFTGKPVTLPRKVIPMNQGVLIRFEEKLDPAPATDPDSFSLASWHYKRSYRYGSPQYRADGEHGIDWHTPSSAYLSEDGKSVFVGVPEMKPVMQLRIGWSLETAEGLPFAENAYTTPYELVPFDPRKEGFGDITVDLTPRAGKEREMGPVTVDEGRKLHQMMGCAACHSTDGTDMQKVGPTWSGLYGSQREVVIDKKQRTVTADEAYLRESILDPSVKTVKGFERSEYAMPSYAGVLTESQVESLVLYMSSLGGGKDGPG